MGFNFSQVFEGARNRSYQKVYIKFSKEGIYFNHTKEAKKGRLLKNETLKDFKLIHSGKNFKFMLFGLEKSYFEFSVPENTKFKHAKFLKDLGRFLNMKIKGGANLVHENILEYIKIENSNSFKSGPTKPNKSIFVDSSRPIKYEKKGDQSKIVEPSFKPKQFYHYNLREEFVIKEFFYEDQGILPKKLWLSRKNKKIWHKHFFLFKESL